MTFKLKHVLVCFLIIALGVYIWAPKQSVSREDIARFHAEGDDGDAHLRNQLRFRYVRFGAGSLIAHAGGAYDFHTYTNSLEALNQSVKYGFKYIEVDFLNTENGDLILLRDWEKNYARLFSPAFKLGDDGTTRVYEKPKTAAEFKSLEMNFGLTALTIEDLVDWMSHHPDIFIITDFKADSLSGLKTLAERSGDVKSRFIPQIYAPEDYAQVKRLGFENIILTTYQIELSPEAIGDFCRKNDLFALTMPHKRMRKDTFQRLGKIDTPVYFHTVNDYSHGAELVSQGAAGVYSDFFYPRNSWLKYNFRKR